MQNKKRLILLVAAAGVFLAVGAFWMNRGATPPAGVEPAAGDSAPQGMPVEAAKVTVDTVQRVVEAVGTLESNESVIVRPEIAGLVKDILFAEGSPVEKDTLLIKLDDSVYKAELAEAQAQLVLSTANARRAEDLYKRETGTARARDEAQAAFESDQAKVALAMAHLDKTEIRAPFAGIIGLRNVSVGDYVTPGQNLVNLEDISSLKADFRVAEVFLPLVHEGQKINVQVDALPGKTFEGVVYAINPRIDESGRSIVVRARIANEGQMLKPGLFARISLVVESHENAVLVPEEALMPQQEHQFVYKVVNGKAEMTPVQIGLRHQGMVEVTQGLSAGDTVVTAGQMKIQPGAPVTVMPPQGAMQGAAQRAEAQEPAAGAENNANARGDGDQKGKTE